VTTDVFAKINNCTHDWFKERENIGKAINILKESIADGWVTKYEAELARL
jgi:nitrogen regulatory protein PII-like uncharacterized protein